MTTSPRRNLIAAAAVLFVLELFALAFLVAGSFGLVRQYAAALRLHLPLATLTTAALAAVCALRTRREQPRPLPSR